MTERKPPDAPFETWVDHLIRQARARGEFDNLSGAGRPAEALDAPYDELWWIRRKAHREGISLLPPTLQLRKDAEDALLDALHARSEREARGIVEAINERIEKALRMPPPGPLLRLQPFDTDAIAAEWRAAHPDRVRPPAAPQTATPRPRRGWWRRRGRASDA
ncbi:DUF1992 domain-containing protein [Yinghuangia seranimata]|uniref:DnaJ family domain-containing protein n=1 Tax=Yinghuangia seranimata TaxID=408067 RepID=UPI00248AEBC7|nr:DUF1992 domain-containing protein [Yinghuangia seranimata]MDI2128476.1 DUF1992 domain-containing protein [Yinghuangia seranimata]